MAWLPYNKAKEREGIESDLPLLTVELKLFKKGERQAGEGEGRTGDLRSQRWLRGLVITRRKKMQISWLTGKKTVISPSFYRTTKVCKLRLRPSGLKRIPIIASLNGHLITV